MTVRLVAPILLLGALALAIGGAALPAVVPASAPPTVVSGARAMALLERIAAEPRPNCSVANANVRDLLVAELERDGHTVERGSGVLGTRLHNLAVEIAGSASTGTLLLLAHHDTVPGSPGAGDDGIGVVSWLEALRALRAGGWRPRNDVLLLLTDGEEYGLLGAMHFSRTDPRAARVRCVVNLEAIGNGGPAYLFELGPHNAERARLHAAAVERPFGSSFAEVVYHLLPNNTDLSVFLQRKIPGFNLALACGSSAYHQSHDTPANIDPRSVQHMADCAAALARALGDADLPALGAPEVGEATFFDGFGRVLFVLPRALEPFLAALALGLGVRLARRAGGGVRAHLAAMAWHLVAVVAAVALAFAFGLGVQKALSGFTPPGNTTSAAAWFVAAVAFGIALGLRAPTDAPALARHTATAVIGWSVAALAACLWLPGGAFVAWLPALVVAFAELLRARVAAFAAAAVALLALLPIVHLLMQLMAPAPSIAAAIGAAGGAAIARLLARSFAGLAAERRWRRGLWRLAAFAAAASLFVAHVLGWRCGALLP